MPQSESSTNDGSPHKQVVPLLSKPWGRGTCCDWSIPAPLMVMWAQTSCFESAASALKHWAILDLELVARRSSIWSLVEGYCEVWSPLSRRDPAWWGSGDTCLLGTQGISLSECSLLDDSLLGVQEVLGSTRGLAMGAASWVETFPGSLDLMSCVGVSRQLAGHSHPFF